LQTSGSFGPLETNLLSLLSPIGSVPGKYRGGISLSFTAKKGEEGSSFPNGADERGAPLLELRNGRSRAPGIRKKTFLVKLEAERKERGKEN